MTRLFFSIDVVKGVVVVVFICPFSLFLLLCITAIGSDGRGSFFFLLWSRGEMLAEMWQGGCGSHLGAAFFLLLLVEMELIQRVQVYVYIR